MKIKPSEVIRPTLVLLIICVVVAAALGGTNALTKDKIAEQSALKSEESRMIVLPDAESFEARESESVGEYYVGISGGEVIGYVFETSAKGYGGDVDIMTGISADGNITGVVILSHDETPGLGANAEKEEFRDQFKQAVPDGDIEIVKYQTPSDGQIEAMTGATITSTAVTNAVNEAASYYREIAEGGE